MTDRQQASPQVTDPTPPQHVHRGQHRATIAASIPLCQDHWRLVLRLPIFPPTFPGQFVQLACRALDLNYNPEREFECSATRPPTFAGQELMKPLAFLRRPFSLAGRRDDADGVELDIIHRVVGVGTHWLAHLKPGDSVGVLGPQGNHFDLPRPGDIAVLVGGGVGIPPMLYLAEKLAGTRAVVFCGALKRDLLPLTVTADAPPPISDGFDPLYNIAEFARHGIPAVISTDDGSYGFRGLITQAVERYLDRYILSDEATKRRSDEGGGEARRHEGTKARSGEGGSAGGSAELAGPQSKIENRESKITIYTCGPEPMMKRVGEIAAARGIECQISVERAMACGMGTCQSCVIRVRKPDPASPPLVGRDWCYRLACTDGPVFRGSDLLW